MKEFDRGIDLLLSGYPEFVQESDQRFQKPLKDFQACYKLTEEIRSNCKKYDEKIKSLRKLASELLTEED